MSRIFDFVPSPLEFKLENVFPPTCRKDRGCTPRSRATHAYSISFSCQLLRRRWPVKRKDRGACLGRVEGLRES
jgi:hypothetical protein